MDAWRKEYASSLPPGHPSEYYTTPRWRQGLSPAPSLPSPPSSRSSSAAGDGWPDSEPSRQEVHHISGVYKKDRGVGQAPLEQGRGGREASVQQQASDRQPEQKYGRKGEQEAAMSQSRDDYQYERRYHHRSHPTDGEAPLRNLASLSVPTVNVRGAHRHLPALTDLLQAAEAGEYVFRVHTATSASALVWTGEERTSGFGCPNGHLGTLTPAAYLGAMQVLPVERRVSGSNAVRIGTGKGRKYSVPHQHPPADSTRPETEKETETVPWFNWTSGPAVRQSVIDHITRRSHLSAPDVPWDGQTLPADAYTPWISTSRDAQWAVWEVARRLRLGEDCVEMAIISLDVPAPEEGRRSRYSGSARGRSGEITLNPLPDLRHHQVNGHGTGDRGRMTHSEKEAVAKAITGVDTSSEVLFFGRVFAKSIIANLAFTRTGLPLELPRHYFRSDTDAWADALTWETNDDYATACRKTEAARYYQGSRK